MKRYLQCLFFRAFAWLARSELIRHQEAMAYHANAAFKANRDWRKAKQCLAELDCPKRALQLVVDRKVPR